METILFTIENHTIAYDVDWLGMETITINGTVVSKKLSLPNRKHRFSLEVYGKTEQFYIKSKSGFSTGKIEVQLFHNDTLIEEKSLAFNFQTSDNGTSKTSDDSLLTLGIIFIVFGIIFDWSKVFLVLAIVFIACGETKKKSQSSTSDKVKEIETKE